MADEAGSDAQDCAVRMWDLRANKCEGLMETPTRSAIAFDQQVASCPQAATQQSSRLAKAFSMHIGHFRMAGR